MKKITIFFFIISLLVNNLNAYKQKDFAKVKRSDKSLSRADLRGAHLEHEFISTIYRRCKLTGANLSRSFLQFADLTGAFMVGAKLEGAKLYKTIFFRVNLNRSNLKNAQASYAYFVRTGLKGACLVSGNFERADFSGAVFSAETQFFEGEELFGANVKHANFYGARGLTRKQAEYLRKNGAFNVPYVE